MFKTKFNNANYIGTLSFKIQDVQKKLFKLNTTKRQEETTMFPKE